MNVSDIKDVAQLAVALIAIGGAFGIPFWMRKLSHKFEALNELANAQLRKNGGTTMTDKVDAMHAAIFPDDEPSLLVRFIATANAVQAIERLQLTRVAEMDANHADNVARLERLETGQHGLDEGQRENAHRLERVELRQQYGQQLLALMIPGLAQAAQEEVRKLLETNPPPGGGL